MEPTARRTAALMGTPLEPSVLELELDHDGRTVTVALRGDLDASTCGDLRDELLGLVGSGHHDLVLVDCTGLRYCGMLGHSVLRRAHRAALAAGCRLRLTNVGPGMRRVARMSGLDEVLGSG